MKVFLSFSEDTAKREFLVILFCAYDVGCSGGPAVDYWEITVPRSRFHGMKITNWPLNSPYGSATRLDVVPPPEHVITSEWQDGYRPINRLGVFNFIVGLGLDGFHGAPDGPEKIQWARLHSLMTQKRIRRFPWLT